MCLGVGVVTRRCRQIGSGHGIDLARRHCNEREVELSFGSNSTLPKKRREHKGNPHSARKEPPRRSSRLSCRDSGEGTAFPDMEEDAVPRGNEESNNPNISDYSPEGMVHFSIRELTQYMFYLHRRVLAIS